jgi:hypothetical protein
MEHFLAFLVFSLLWWIVLTSWFMAMRPDYTPWFLRMWRRGR